MSKRGKQSVDAALDDLSAFMAGRRDFEDRQPYSEKKPPLWQAGYRHGIRTKSRDGEITLKERLLIARAKPRFAALRRSA